MSDGIKMMFLLREY